MNRKGLIGRRLALHSLIAIGAIAGLSGCATTKQVEDCQATANQAMAVAEEARAMVDQAENAARRAELAADRAEMAAEKAERIFMQKMKK